MPARSEWLATALEELDSRGFTIISDFLEPDRLRQVDSRIEALRGRHRGRNNFEGTHTERIYTLVARDRVSGVTCGAMTRCKAIIGVAIARPTPGLPPRMKAGP